MQTTAAKVTLFSLFVAASVSAQMCPLEPPELPPVGMISPQHTCVCSGNSFNCGWAWIAGSSVPASGSAFNSPAAAALLRPIQVEDPQKQRLAIEQMQLQNDAMRKQMGLPTSYELRAMKEEAKREQAELKRQRREQEKLDKQLAKQRKANQAPASSWQDQQFD